MTKVAAQKARGLPVWWVLAAAAVGGTVVGVGLGLKRTNEADQAMKAAVDQAARAVPMGAPLPVPSGPVPVDVTRPDPASLEGIPIYPHAAPRKLGDGLAAQGSPLAISWFSTQDKPSEVLAFYDHEYTRRNMVHATHQFDDDMGYVAWLNMAEPDAGAMDGTLHMISAVKSGHETLVFASASHPLEIMSGMAPQLPPGMRLPDDASTPVIVNLSQEGVHRLGVHSSLKHGAVNDVTAFFVDHFKTGGWSIVERTDSPERTGLTAQRANVLQSVMISKQADGVDMMISYDERAGRPAQETNP